MRSISSSTSSVKLRPKAARQSLLSQLSRYGDLDEPENVDDFAYVTPEMLEGLFLRLCCIPQAWHHRLSVSPCVVSTTGCVVSTTGCVVLPIGCAALPIGCVVLPIGCVVLPIGCVILPLGCVVLPIWCVDEWCRLYTLSSVMTTVLVTVSSQSLQMKMRQLFSRRGWASSRAS